MFFKTRNYQSAGNQIDRNYEGENEDSLSQNRYTYTLNNPYKYIDKDGNIPTNTRGILLEMLNKHPEDGWMPSTWITNVNGDFSKFKNTLRIGKLPSIYCEDAKRYFFNPPKGIRLTAVMIKLKAEVFGPPAPPRWTPPNTSSKKSTNNSTGVVTKPTLTTPKPTPPKTLTNVEVECPITLTTNNWIELLTTCFDWGMIIKDLQKEVVKNLFEVKTIEIMAKHAKGGKIKMGTVISATKAKDLIRDLKNVPKSSLSTIASSMKGSIGKQLGVAFSDGLTWVGMIMNWVAGIAEYAIKAFFGIITWIRCAGSVIGSAIYILLKEAAIAVIRGALLPFIGPFAWLVGMVADYGFYWLKYIIDIEGVCNDIGEWMIKSAYDSVTTFAGTISKIL